MADRLVGVPRGSDPAHGEHAADCNGGSGECGRDAVQVVRRAVVPGRAAVGGGKRIGRRHGEIVTGISQRVYYDSVCCGA